jgi:large subunit ribosomal protein L17
VAYSKLSRDSSARKALFRDLVTDLFLYERIQTTEAKAKEVRAIAEKLITLAKRGDLQARRQAAAYVRKELLKPSKKDIENASNEDQSNKKKRVVVVKDGLVYNQYALEKLFSELATRYADRSGGYTRILKLGPRRGDAAPMVYLELVDRP